MPSKASVAIVGSGNIGTDLLYKLLRSDWLEPRWMVGVDPESRAWRGPASGPGDHPRRSRLAAGPVRETRPRVRGDLRLRAPGRAPKYASRGIRAIDLTPAAVGPAVIPPVNLGEHLDAPNVNMITCGGQATIPIVYAVSRVVDVDYAEIVATVASGRPARAPGPTSTSSPRPPARASR